MHEHDDEQRPVRDLGEVLDGFRFAMVATVVDGSSTPEEEHGSINPTV